MVLRMIALDRGAFEMYLQSDKRTYYSRIILILIGVALGSLRSYSIARSSQALIRYSSVWPLSQHFSFV
ncbi:hypothetical protein [Geomicrobium sp. JCM 19037]|uniref:hypothetical protein n=1 Tax=Geomicrobium sp. JCM 19037 TaxID=1460634 RepID=UPI000693B895|nr:hypothetical protein [Geomicrobium sp. JCM 19037]